MGRAGRAYRLRHVAVIVVMGGNVFSGPFDAGRAGAVDVGDVAHVLVKGWDDLTPQERARARKNYQRFEALPAEKQRSLRQRYHQWQKMPPQEQRRIRRNYERYRGMDAKEKKQFQRKYRQWRNDRR